jgi:hypothetical protein
MRILLLLFLSAPTALWSQQVNFQKAIGKNATNPILGEVGLCVRQTFDGGYIVAGTSFGSSSSEVYLVRTNAYGDTLWTQTIGGPNSTFARWIEQTSDSGFILVGDAWLTQPSSKKIYAVRMNASGSILWQKTYGDSSRSEEGYAVQQTADGGFIIAGTQEVLNLKGSLMHACIVRTNPQGDSIWTKTIGGPNGNSAWGYGVRQTTDGGFILCGQTGTNADIFLVKFLGSGPVAWVRTLGGAGMDGARSIALTADGGFLLAGYSQSSGAGGMDMYLVKTDGAAGVQWSKTYGGAADDMAWTAVQTTDGGYLAVGYTASFGAGDKDAVLLRTDNTGNLLWSKTYGGAGEDIGYSVRETTDGGYVLSGTTTSSMPSYHIYFIKSDSLGSSGCNEGNINPQVLPASVSLTLEQVTIGVYGNARPIALLTSRGGNVHPFCYTGQPEMVTQLNAVLFPNPVNDYTTLSISAPFDVKGMVLEIFDLPGKKMSQVQITGEQTVIHRGDLASGIYFYRISGQGRLCASGKLIAE